MGYVHKFEKNYSFDEGTLYFSFIGLRENIDIEDKERILNRLYQNNPQKRLDIKKIVDELRIVFRNDDEVSLVVNINYKNGNKVNVKYEGKELSNYESHISMNKDRKYLDVVDNHNGINFSINDALIKDIDINEFPDINLNFGLELRNIFDLKKYKSLELNEKHQLLCSVYKMFFDEYPDFSLNECVRKAHAMISILLFYDIMVDDSYNFSILPEKIVYSTELQNVINELAPLGILNLDKDIPIIYNNKIIEIGKVIREYDSSLEYLEKISSIVCFYNYEYNSNFDENIGLDYIGVDKKELKDVQSLIKKVKLI